MVNTEQWPGARGSAQGAKEKRGHSWRSDGPALAVLLGLVVIFFWPVLTGQAWLPFGGGDLASFLYPMYRFAAQSLRAGQIPLWNPYQYAGAPFLADNQAGLFYPPNLALFLLWPTFSYRAIEALVMGHIFVAGASMYFCLRGLRLGLGAVGRVAALIGATAFMFSDIFITHIGNLNLIAVAAWLPVVFLAFQRALVADNGRLQLLWAASSGVALGIATLAGHGQMTFLLAAFLGSYAFYTAINQRQGWPILLLGFTGLVATAVAAISLFPALEGVAYTVRGGFSPDQALRYSLPWRGLVGLVSPDFFGRGAVRFWGDWDRVEAGYLGVLPWLLALLALTLNRHTTRRLLFFPLAALLFLLLALGANAPLYPLLLRLLPFFPFQVPARFVLLTDFCLALLAAYGWQQLLLTQPAWRQIGLVLGAVGGVTAVLAIHYGNLFPAHEMRQPQMFRAVLVWVVLGTGCWLLLLGRQKGWLRSRWIGWALLALLATDLIGLGRYVEIDGHSPAPGFAENSPALDFLRADPGIHRIDIATGHWQPGLPQLVGQYSIGGVYNPLEQANYAGYIGSVGFRGSPQYNLLGVKYVIGGQSTPPGDTNFIVPVFAADPNVIVYLNTRALPRALVLANATVVADHDAAFTAIHTAAFDPTQTVVLEGGRPLAQIPTAAPIEILQYDLNESRFRVTTDQPAYFVLSDLYHPLWQASVDGQPADILPANYAFRAVYLEPGRHEIRFWFASPGWWLGTAVSLLTWLGLALFWVWRRLRCCVG